MSTRWAPPPPPPPPISAASSPRCKTPTLPSQVPCCRGREEDDATAFDLHSDGLDLDRLTRFSISDAEAAVAGILEDRPAAKPHKPSANRPTVLSPCTRTPSAFTSFLKTLSPHGVSWGSHLERNEGMFKLDRSTGLLAGAYAEALLSAIQFEHEQNYTDHGPSDEVIGALTVALNISDLDVESQRIVMEAAQNLSRNLHAAVPRNLITWSPDSGPHQVFISIEDLRVTSLSTIDQVYHACFAVNIRWLATCSDVLAFTADAKSFEPLWRPPPIIFPNHSREAPEVISKITTMIPQGEMMVNVHRVCYSGAFTERLELAAFPFDVQDLMLELHFAVMENEAHLNPDMNDTRHGVFVSLDIDGMMLPEWSLHAPIVEIEQAKTVNSYTTWPAALRVRLKIARVWRGYMYKVVLPLFLVCAGSSLAFLLQPQTNDMSQDDRLNHACTMGLTAILYQMVVSQMLPSLAYLTVMDKFVLTAFLFIAMVIMEVGIICAWNFQEYPAFFFGFQVNLAGIVCFFVGFAVYVGLSLIPLERAKLSQHSEDLEDTNKKYQLVADGTDMVSNHFTRVFMMDRWHGKTELYNECIAYFANAKLAGITDEALTMLSGVWYTKTFYGDALTYVKIMVITHEDGTQGLRAIKIAAQNEHGSMDEGSGGFVVPAGTVTWQTQAGTIPTDWSSQSDLAKRQSVPIQVRTVNNVSSPKLYSSASFRKALVVSSAAAIVTGSHSTWTDAAGELVLSSETELTFTRTLATFHKVKQCDLETMCT